MNIDFRDNSAIILKFFSKNKTLILSFLCVLIGIVAGAWVYNLTDSLIKDELLQLVISFHKEFTDNTSFLIPFGMFVSSLTYFTLMFILGGNLFGVYLSLLTTVLKTTGIGALVAHFYQQYGTEGFEYVLLIFIPGKILYFFALLFITNCSLETSLNLRDGIHREEVVKVKKVYIMKYFFVFTVILFSCLIDFLCLKLFSSLVNFI